MSEPTIRGVSLHEHLEALSRAERRRVDQRFESEKELVRTEFDKIEQATKLQAGEYERRLDVLNHAHAEAQRVLATYLPREAYEAYVKEQAAADEQRQREEEAKAEILRQSVRQTRERFEEATSALERSLKATADRLNVQIAELKTIQTRREGAQEGLSTTGKIVVAALGAVATVLTIVVLAANHAL